MFSGLFRLILLLTDSPLLAVTAIMSVQKYISGEDTPHCSGAHISLANSLLLCVAETGHVLPVHNVLAR